MESLRFHFDLLGVVYIRQMVVKYVLFTHYPEYFGTLDLLYEFHAFGVFSHCRASPKLLNLSNISIRFETIGIVLKKMIELV
jgi:hypothetical protein